MRALKHRLSVCNTARQGAALCSPATDVLTIAIAQALVRLQPGGSAAVNSSNPLPWRQAQNGLLLATAAVALGLANDDFLILPHPEVARFEQRRAGDRARWLAGMQKLQASLPGG